MRGSLFDGRVDQTSSVVQRKPLLFNSLSKRPAQAVGRTSSSPRSYSFTSAKVRTPVYTATKDLFTW